MGESKTINLLRGYPNPKLLPIEAVRGATNRVLDNQEIAETSLLYGPDAGYPPFLKALSGWLSSFYEAAKSRTYGESADSKARINPDRLVATCGASQSLAVILNVLTDPIFTRKIWIVAPAYFLAFRMFEDAGFQGRLNSIPELHSGPDIGADVAWLRRELQRDQDTYEASASSPEADRKPFKNGNTFRKLYRHIIYVVPTYANPSSVTTSLSCREGLVSCARDFDALIVCDDVYDMLQWHESDEEASVKLREAQVPRLVDIDSALGGGTDRDDSDGFGNVISNGSFSKICGPGCRLGWAESTPKVAKLLAESGTSKSGDTAPVFMSAMMADMITTGALGRHVFETLQPSYASRYRTLVESFREHLSPIGGQMSQVKDEGKVSGGYFIWITLPDGLYADEVADFAAQHYNLVMARGPQFEIPGDPYQLSFRRNLRLSFAWEDEAMLIEGILRLQKVCQTLLSVSAESGPGRRDRCK